MKYLVAALALVLGMMATASFAAEEMEMTEREMPATQPAAEKEEKRIGDPWTLKTCPVSGEKLGAMGEPVVYLHEGREVRFCCEGCVPRFKDEPEKYLSKADKKMIEQQKEFYPLDHCIVDTDEDLSEDESENAYEIVGNRLFIYCCPPCSKKVHAEPAKYIKILDEAVIESQKEDYPLETCVISGHALDSMGGPINMVIGNQLVQLCCKGCQKKVEENPSAILKKLAEARGDSVESTDN